MIGNSPTPTIPPSENQVIISAATKDLFSGQRLVQYAAIFFLVGVAISVISSFTGKHINTGLIAIILFGLGFTGAYQISRGLGYGILKRIVIMLSMLIPFIGLAILLYINSRATVALRAAGYTVGVLGARAKQG